MLYDMHQTVAVPTVAQPASKFKVAINKSIIDKVPAGDTTQFRILTDDFENHELTLAELVQEIDQGHPFCAQHKGKRKSANFICNQVLAVDIDHGMSFNEALNDSFVKQYAAFLYTTPTHTEANNRFRIVLLLEDPITDKDIMRNANKGVIKKFGGDDSCQDACRIFYGSKGSNPIVLGNVLPNSELEKLIELGIEGTPISDQVSTKSNRPGAPASRRSNITINSDALIRLKGGMSLPLSAIPPQTKVYCPVHLDKNPSAFVTQSKQSINGVYCSRCHATYWPTTLKKRPIQEYDFYEIENIVTKLEYFESREIYFEGEYADADFGENTADGDNASADLLEYEVNNRSSHMFNQEQLSYIHVEKGVTFIRSPKGSGKTHTLIPSIERFKREGLSVLLIGHRQILLQSMAQRLGLTCYFYNAGNKIKNNAPTNYYAVSIDSISKILTPSVNKYDVVIIDESEQVLSHLTASTLQERRRQCYKTFFHYVAASQYVIVADADLGPLTIEGMYQAIGGASNYDFYLNTYQANQCDFQVFSSETQLLQDMIEVIAAGGRHYIATNSLTKAKELSVAIGEKIDRPLNIMVVTSEVSGTPEVQNFINKIKTEILKYDVVIASPSLGTGVDITFSDGTQHIDTVFGFFVARVNTHFDIDQQLSRVRNPKAMKVWVTPEQFHFETEPEVIRLETLRNAVLNDTLIGFERDTGALKVDETYLSVYAHVQSMMRASKNDLRKNLLNLRARNGWNIVPILPDKTKSEKGKDTKAYSKEIVEQQRVKEIFEAREIEFEEFAEITKKSHQASKQENAEIERYKIGAYYCETVTPELISLDEKGAYRRMVEMMQIYLSDKSALAEQDNYDTDKIVSDQKKRVLKQSVLKSLLTAAGISDPANPIKTDVVLTTEKMGQFITECRRHKLQIQDLFNMSLRADLDEKPIAQLGKILKLIGSSLELLKAPKVDGKKVRIYKVNQGSWETAKDYAERRIKRTNRK